MKVWNSRQTLRKLFRGKRHPIGFPRMETEHGWESASDGRAFSRDEMSVERRWHIISAYGRVLEGCSSSIEPDSHLPFAKSLIREAIRSELSENPHCELRNHLEIAYVQLEFFLPAEDFEVIEKFKQASVLARRMSRSGEPGDIVASARLLKLAQGDRAVKIQERVSERMRTRLSQIRATGAPFFHVGACACSYEA